LKYKTLLTNVFAFGVFLIFMTLISAKFSNAGDISPETVAKPEVPYDEEVPLVPSVRPVIVLKGTDYEMGYQHAKQLIQIFGKYYLEGAAKAK